MHRSLKTDFPDFLETSSYKRRFLLLINDKKGGLLIIPLTISIFILSQFLKPKFLQIIPLPFDSAKTIIDQRITNLAAIFSITLVVIGWLITNLTVKESLSYRLLFKSTYLYPIFYFIITLISCLILSSLLRNVNSIGLGDIVIAGTYLIIIALAAITFLFVRLIEVVGKSFFFDNLEKEVLFEVRTNSLKIIAEKVSGKKYSEVFEELGYIRGIPFTADLKKHSGIALISGKKDKSSSGVKPNNEPVSILMLQKDSYKISDINLSRISATLKEIKIESDNYYLPLSMNSKLNPGFSPIYFNQLSQISEESKVKIKKSYKLRYNTKDDFQPDNKTFQDYLNEQFLSSVKDGKTANIERTLAIYEKIYELENRINTEK